jgi:hypothetical protein
MVFVTGQGDDEMSILDAALPAQHRYVVVNLRRSCPQDWQALHTALLTVAGGRSGLSGAQK